jgi:hypothetical protein
MWDKFPHELTQAVQGAVWTAILAIVGRLMWHSLEVQRKNRTFLSLALLWEMPVAIGMGFIAAGVSDYVGLDGYPRDAAVVFLAYLGPRGIEEILAKVIAARSGGRS